ncbi:hypothetical protein GSH19_05710 [Lactobacillus sp. S2-2]|uniref:sigma factor n=1 Tax=Lactobacillus sp. S2-2 TaxID=2692917 RepID=UPI001F3AE660|nr:sigma factor [Lactobacillus sp. S2-2]MCF6515644.1 hypothetical protein [Lactobacillus sp. S2-2]
MRRDDFEGKKNRLEKMIQLSKKGDDVYFEMLMQKYRPILLKFWSMYNIDGMDLNDFEQEAAIVMLKTLVNFKEDRNITFGAFYKSNLRNHIFDLLRKMQAQKRIPSKNIISFQEVSLYFEETIIDPKVEVDAKLKNTEIINEALSLCNCQEKEVLMNVLTKLDAEIDSSNVKYKLTLGKCRKKLKTCIHI